MEEASLLTQNTYSLLNTTDKHGLPPISELWFFVHRVTELDSNPRISISIGKSWRSGTTNYVKWSTPSGLNLAQKKIFILEFKDEDSITDVRKRGFDLVVMESLCFPHSRSKSFHRQNMKFIILIELNLPGDRPRQ
ncbi:hypothetical protein Tco_0351135 [Tanacetum coccineum]